MAKYKGGITAHNRSGRGGIILDFLLVASYVTVNGYLANSPSSLSLIAGIIILGFIIFFIAKAYRKIRGIDISLSFKELPPE